MSATEDGIVHYTCTRISLINALRYLPLARHMHLEALGGLADSVLEGLPEAPADVLAGGEGLYRAVNDAIAAERERIADMADRLAATAPAGGGEMPFGRIIRQAHRGAPPEPDRAVCGRCGASLARASWRLPWSASEAPDPVWCVVDGVWQSHNPAQPQP